MNNDTKIGRLFLIFVRKNREEDLFLAFAFNDQYEYEKKQKRHVLTVPASTQVYVSVDW
jgi:hypothetical protein